MKRLSGISVSRFLILLILATGICSCGTGSKYASLQAELEEFVADKDAKIGVAVIIDGKDTVAVNGNEQFPMMSVYKFPITMAVVKYCRLHNMDFTDSCSVTRADLHTDTYSPMMKKYGDTDSTRIAVSELLAYSLQQSDNNASDILLNLFDSPEVVDLYISNLGIDGINIAWSEDDMHKKPGLCYENSSTPIAMAQLMDMFDREHNDPLSAEIKRLMESCETGTDRLAKPLMPTNAVIGHKTGTGDTTPDGRLMAVNDAGYVHLPNGHRYSIAVFIAYSGYDMAQTSKLIADISAIVAAGIQ